MFKKRVLTVLLSVVMTATMLVALPTAAHAAQTIDISTTDGGATINGGINSGGDVGTDNWVYIADDHILFLPSAGPYRLIGSNSSITIIINADGAEVTLDNVIITGGSSPANGLAIWNNCALTLVGTNSVTGNGDSGLSLAGNRSCTVTGNGTLTATGTGFYPGITLNSGSSLLIDDNAEVTAVGGATGRAITNGGTIQIGDNAKLTMTNNSGGETHTFTKAGTAETHIWKLTNATPESGPLDDDTIIVSIAIGATGTVEREATYVCAIGTTRYTTLAAALAAVPTGGTSQTVIRLLTDITETVNPSISDKKITFDLNGNNLRFVQLSVRNGSIVNYTGSGEFTVVCHWSFGGNGTGTSGLYVEGASTVELTSVEIKDGGTGTDRISEGIEISGGSIVTVNGGVTAESNGGANSNARGIYFHSGGGTVTVNGDIISSEYGVLSYGTASNVSTVTVSGAIKAEGEGVHVGPEATLTVNGNIEADGHGVVAKAGTATNPTKVTINGDIDAGRYGVDAEANTTVTVTGDIDAYIDGVHARGGAKVTVTGDITAQIDDGVDAFGTGTEVTVNGTIEAIYGIYAGDGAKVTVNSDITADTKGVLASYDGTEVTVNGNIISEWYGVDAFGGVKVTVNGNITADSVGVYVESATVTVNGNITAGYVGVEAWGEAVAFVGGNIDITEPDDPDFSVCGVFVVNGAKVTVEGTIAAPNYVGFLIPFVDAGEPWFYYLIATENTSPSLETGYLQYDDEGKYDMLGSYVWVKDPRTLTPGTGDSTALWLTLGALLVAALGTGSVLAYRRREQQD